MLKLGEVKVWEVEKYKVTFIVFKGNMVLVSTGLIYFSFAILVFLILLNIVRIHFIRVSNSTGVVKEEIFLKQLSLFRLDQRYVIPKML